MKTDRIFKMAIAAALTVLPLGAMAQENVKTLDECIREAMENNLPMQSGRIAIKRAEALQGTAFDIDKTNLSLGQDPTSGGSPDNSLTLSQSFDFPTVYTTRHRLLKAETALERNRLELTRNELVKEITSAYYQVLYTRERIHILQTQDSIYSKFLFLADAKYKAGETGQLERMNAERLSNENKIELQNAEKTYRNAQYLLQQWMNYNAPITPAEAVLNTIDSAPDTDSFNAAGTLFGQFARQEMEVSARNLKSVQQGYLPSFSVAARNQLVINGFNPYNVDRSRFDKGNFMGFEVGVSVPLFFGAQRAKTKAARREVEMASLRHDEQIQVLDKTFQRYQNEFFKAQNSLDYYEMQGVNQANEISRISQISYEKGAIDYVEYIQNLKTSVDIRMQYANAKNDYNQAVIMLNYLQGNK